MLALCRAATRCLASHARSFAAEAPDAAAAAVKEAFFAAAARTVKQKAGGKAFLEAAEKFATLDEALSAKTLALKKQGLTVKQVCLTAAFARLGLEPT